jgi:hypothetical protein
MVYKLDLLSGAIAVIAGNNIVNGLFTDGADARSNSFNRLNFIKVVDGGRILMTDLTSSRVIQVIPNTYSPPITPEPLALAYTAYLVAGNGSEGYAGENVAATSSMIQRPVDCTVDKQGNVIISSINQARILQVSSTSKLLTTYAGNGNPTYNDSYFCRDRIEDI